MRRITVAVALVLCLCTPVKGETVQIGRTEVAYSLPAEFARADGLFPMNLKDLDQEFGMETVVFATVIPEADLAARQRDPRAVPSWYIHLAYDAIFSKLSIGDAGFVSVTWMVEKVIAGQYANAGFLKKLEDVISGALNRELSIRSMTQKGFVEKTPRCHSMLAYGRGDLEGDNGTEDVTMATMTTFFLAEGKLVAIVQACRVQSEEAIPAFTEKALRLAAEIIGRSP